MPIDKARTPFDKILTPRNVLSRMDKLERVMDTSARADDLRQIAPEAGDISMPATTQQSTLGGPTFDTFGFARSSGRRMGIGITPLGSSTMECIGGLFAVTGAGALGCRNGRVYRTFTSGAVTGNVAGITSFGQAAGFVTLASNPYFCALVRTPSTKNFQIYAGLTSEWPISPPYHAVFLVNSASTGLWGGAHVPSNLDVPDLPPLISDTDYFLEFSVDTNTLLVSFAVNGVEASGYSSALADDLTTLLYPFVIISTNEDSAKSIDIYGAYVEFMAPDPEYNPNKLEYVSRPDSTDDIDTYLNSNSAATNYSTDAYVAVGESNSAAAIWRTLIKDPNFATIPATAIIDSVTLRVVINSDYATNADTWNIYRVLRNWVLAEATWNNYSAGNAWGTAGCGNSTTDYDGATVLASYVTTGAIPAGTIVDFDFTAAGIAEFTKLVDGTYPNNYGFLIRGTTENADGYRLESAESTRVGTRPTFIAQYHLPS